VVLQFVTSLDGYSADAGNGIRDFMMSIDDPEQEKYALSRLWQAGTHIMGRVSYQEMAPFWPASSLPAATPMNDIPKIVFSRTQTSAGWPESRITGGGDISGLIGVPRCDRRSSSAEKSMPFVYRVSATSK
jgi:dihydrofolate reductase